MPRSPSPRPRSARPKIRQLGNNNNNRNLVNEEKDRNVKKDVVTGNRRGAKSNTNTNNSSKPTGVELAAHALKREKFKQLVIKLREETKWSHQVIIQLQKHFKEAQTAMQGMTTMDNKYVRKTCSKQFEQDLKVYKTATPQVNSIQEVCENMDFVAYVRSLHMLCTQGSRTECMHLLFTLADSDCDGLVSVGELWDVLEPHIAQRNGEESDDRAFALTSIKRGLLLKSAKEGRTETKGRTDTQRRTGNTLGDVLDVLSVPSVARRVVVEIKIGDVVKRMQRNLDRNSKIKSEAEAIRLKPSVFARPGLVG